MLQTIALAVAVFALMISYASANDAGKTAVKKSKTADCEKDSGTSAMPSLNDYGICRPDSADSAAGYRGFSQSPQFRKTTK